MVGLVAALSLTIVPAAWAPWSTISDEAYEGGLVCRDGMTFNWGDYTSDTSNPPNPSDYPATINTRLVVAYATPAGGQPQVPPGSPVPSASVAYDHGIHADFYPQLVELTPGDPSSQIYLIHWGQYQINWRTMRNPGDTVRLIFDYPDSQDNTVDIGDSPSSLVLVKDCLVPRVRVGSGGTPTIDPTSTQAITVSLLGNAKFNVNRINLATVRAGGPNQKATPLSTPTLTDVNGDGRKDVKARFRISDMHLVCGGKRVYFVAYTNGTSPVPVVGRAAAHILSC